MRVGYTKMRLAIVLLKDILTYLRIVRQRAKTDWVEQSTSICSWPLYEECWKRGSYEVKVRVILIE